MSSIKVKSKLKKFEWAIGYYHFPIDQKTTNLLASETHKRVICTINGKVKIHCALMPMKNHSFIMVNKKIRQQLNLTEDVEVELSLEKETAVYGMPMPESFEMVMMQDDVAFEHFKNLTPGKQRSLIYIVSKLKSIDKQITKALAIAAHLTEMNGKLDYKLLNEKIKAFNQDQNLL